MSTQQTYVKITRTQEDNCGIGLIGRAIENIRIERNWPIQRMHDELDITYPTYIRLISTNLMPQKRTWEKIRNFR